MVCWISCTRIIMFQTSLTNEIIILKVLDLYTKTILGLEFFRIRKFYIVYIKTVIRSNANVHYVLDILVSKTHMMSHFTLTWCIVLNIARNPLSCDLPRTTFGKVTVEVICLVIAKGAYSLFKNGYLSTIPCQRAKIVNGHQDMGERIWAIPYDHPGKILVNQKLLIKLKEHIPKF